jgi:adenylate kinase family enzyme
MEMPKYGEAEMAARAIHITGASGAGTTTLGRALAARLGCMHLDTDDFYWLPVEPAYSAKRPAPERLRLLGDKFREAGTPGGVLSGSIGDWGAPLIPLFSLVVFLCTPTDIRIARLRAREARQSGAAAIAPGGSRHAEHEAFLQWSADYDAGTVSGRNLARHEAWLAKLPCPVIRLDGTEEVDTLVEKVLLAD